MKINWNLWEKLEKLHAPYLSRQKKAKKKLELTKKERAVNTHKPDFRVSKTLAENPERNYCASERSEREQHYRTRSFCELEHVPHISTPIT